MAALRVGHGSGRIGWVREGRRGAVGRRVGRLVGVARAEAPGGRPSDRRPARRRPDRRRRSGRSAAAASGLTRRSGSARRSVSRTGSVRSMSTASSVRTDTSSSSSAAGASAVKRTAWSPSTGWSYIASVRSHSSRAVAVGRVHRQHAALGHVEASGDLDVREHGRVEAEVLGRRAGASPHGDQQGARRWRPGARWEAASVKERWSGSDARGMAQGREAWEGRRRRDPTARASRDVEIPSAPRSPPDRIRLRARTPPFRRRRHAGHSPLPPSRDTRDWPFTTCGYRDHGKTASPPPSLVTFGQCVLVFLHLPDVTSCGPNGPKITLSRG